jgi:hypothetical protein
LASVEVPLKPNVTDRPGSIRRFHARLPAVTVAPSWVSAALQWWPTAWSPTNDQDSAQPSTVVVPRLVSVTWVVNPPGHWPWIWYSTAQLARRGGVPSPWSARNDAIQASAEFQLIATSLVDHDWMSST